MRSISAITVFAFVASTSPLVVSGTSSSVSYDVPTQQFGRKEGWMAQNNRSQQTINRTNIEKIPKRVLVLNLRIPQTPVKPLNTTPQSTKKCRQTNYGKDRQPHGCEFEVYTIFGQSYMPTVVSTRNALFRREVTSDEVVDWNNNLKIHGLWPQNSKGPASTLPFHKTLKKR